MNPKDFVFAALITSQISIPILCAIIASSSIRAILISRKVFSSSFTASAARALDAIHLSSARLFHESANIDILFITSDKKQKDVALQEGFKTLFIE